MADSSGIQSNQEDIRHCRFKVAIHIVVSFQNWVEEVEERGLEEVRKIPGYHDEPLRGELKGLRSIRLSRGYRAYYRIVDGQVQDDEDFLNLSQAMGATTA